jgi:peptide/nickel transport system substrate-binding protein
MQPISIPTSRLALVAALAMLLVNVPIAARAQSAANANPLRIAMTLADIPSTDGAPDQGTEGIRFMGYTLYDPLIMWDLSSADRPARLIPGLATGWHRDPADPTKWIFELRRGVRFHDGSEFNADAVLFNLERALNDQSPYYDRSFRAQVLPAIPSVASWRKLDDFTVELTTNGVDGLMPYQLNRFLIASPAQYEKLGRNWQAFRQQPSGTGPWKLKSFMPRERAELVRNPDYWNPARVPKSAAMVLYPIPDVSARTAALLTGRVDWAELPAPDTVARLKASNMVVQTNLIPHVWPYTLSLAPGMPTADLRVRQALNLAIDRDGLVKLLGGFAVASVAQVPPGHPWFGAPSFKIRYDPEAAKQLLAAAGYGPDNHLKLKVSISTSGSGQMYPLIMNEAIQQNLAQVDVDLELEVFEWNALTTRNRQGAAAPENQGLAATNNSWNTMDPYQAFVRFADSKLVPPRGNNWGGIDDPELDALVAEARRADSVEALDRILARIDSRMVDQAYFVWIVHDVWPTALSPRVKGYVHPQSWYVDFSPVTVD